jgi:hypothetical protein
VKFDAFREVFKGSILNFSFLKIYFAQIQNKNALQLMKSCRQNPCQGFETTIFCSTCGERRGQFFKRISAPTRQARAYATVAFG